MSATWSAAPAWPATAEQLDQAFGGQRLSGLGQQQTEDGTGGSGGQMTGGAGGPPRYVGAFRRGQWPAEEPGRRGDDR